MAQKIKKLSKKFIALTCMFALVFSHSVVTNTSDAAISSAKDQLSDSRPNTDSSHTITFTASDTVAGNDTNNLTLTFEADFQDVATIAVGDITWTDDAGGKTIAANCSGSEDIGYSVSGNVMTFLICSDYDTAAGIVANSVIVITIDGAVNDIKNPAAAATCGTGDDSNICSIDVASTPAGNTGTIQVAILAGVAVSATVDTYMTFTASDYDIGFGSWSGGSTVTHYATSDNSTATSAPGAGDPLALTFVSSNSGGSITVKSINSNSTAGLYSSGASSEIEAIAGGAFGVADDAEGFGIYGSSATMTMHDDFDNDSTDGQLTTSNKTFADASTVGSNTVEVDMKAAIAASTPAGSYSTTIVFVATSTY